MCRVDPRPQLFRCKNVSINEQINLYSTFLKIKFMKTSIIKHITIIFCFLLLSPTLSLAQEDERTPQEMHDMFMKKHKNKKIAAFVTLGAGVALATTGIIVIGSDNGHYGHLGFIAGGAVLSLVSIPIFISARRSQKKADLYLNKKTVVLGVSNTSNNYSLSATFSF